MVQVSFLSLLVIFNFFSQINHFYYFTSLYGLQDVENHCAHLRDIDFKTGRKIPYLFPHHDIILYIIGLERMKLQNIKYIFASNPEKKTQKQAQKDMNEMEWHKMD